MTVVDTGFPRSWGTLERVLGELGRTTKDVVAVVLTHAHFDHMGFAERAPVWAHEQEVPVTRHPWRYDHERPRAVYLRHPRFAQILAARRGGRPHPAHRSRPAVAQGPAGGGAPGPRRRPRLTGRPAHPRMP